MAYACPECGRQYDATLFQFGRSVRCECGEWVDRDRGHRRPPDGRHRPERMRACPTFPEDVTSQQ